MKIIDLLNKIANGEEVPQKIIYKDNEYKWERNTDYRKGDIFLFTEECICQTFLNAKVEIIEEEKEIEKLDVALLGQCDNWLRCPTNEATKQDVELNPYIIDNIRENTLYFQRKINELIETINSINKGK